MRQVSLKPGITSSCPSRDIPLHFYSWGHKVQEGMEPSGPKARPSRVSSQALLHATPFIFCRLRRECNTSCRAIWVTTRQLREAATVPAMS